MPKTSLNIDVLGISFLVSAEEDRKYLDGLLELYRQKLKETTKTTGLTDPLKIAVLTGFILCDEAEKARQNLTPQREKKPGKDLRDESKEAEKLTLNLISQLESVLGEIGVSGGTEKDGRRIYKLRNTVKNYDWGSSGWIPELLGEKEDPQVPQAELWMGVHPEGPSRIVPQENEKAGEEFPLLRELIAKDPGFFLGEEQVKTFGALPFLFKVLAAEKPLSIQAHPSLAQAQEGWERENRRGIPLNAPNRNYKDANHKPEILCALSPFTAMAGFREPREIKNLLEKFSQNAPEPLRAALAPLLHILEETENPLRTFLKELFGLPQEVREALGGFALTQTSDHDEGKLIAEFARAYPGDPAILSPFYLNLINLSPGEAIYLPAGILHAYVHGLGVELMANSDNVLRGGLTSKHMDLEELFRVLEFTPFTPAILKETWAVSGRNYFRYAVPCREFCLSVIRRGAKTYPETGPSIALVTQGELVIKGKNGETTLKKGESAFISAGEENLELSGDFTLYAAGTGPLSNPEKTGPETRG